MSKQTAVTDHLPIKPNLLNILLVLAQRDHHGYSLIQALKERPILQMRVHTGPLYRALKQLLDAGLIEEGDTPPSGVADDVRRGSYYRLSRFGRRVLDAELTRLAGVVRLGRRIGLAKGGGT